ncbi:hypothetical protein BH10PSE9_BH10PSE9_11960 [soil metagenome]
MVDIALVETSSADGEESSASAVSWGAIIVGGVVSSAVAFLLFILGAGLGLSTASMLTTQTATALGVGTIIWLIVTQWVSGGIGGYLTGRLRTKWVRVHSDEVFFRDTAHVFAAWALGVVVSMSILARGAAAVIGGVGSAATTVAASAVQGGAQAAGQALSSPTTDDYLDTLFRPAAPAAASAAAAPAAAPAAGGAPATAPATTVAPPASGAPAGTAAPETPATPAAAAGGRSTGDVRAEAGRILIRSMGSADPIPAADKTYLAQLVAARAGISQADAEKRIDDITAQAKAAADKAKQVADDARKAAAALALFTFVSLLIGAFISSAAAAFGGNQRDENEALYLTTTRRS